MLQLSVHKYAYPQLIILAITSTQPQPRVHTIQSKPVIHSAGFCFYIVSYLSYNLSKMIL
jgi:hypothetical protein